MSTATLLIICITVVAVLGGSVTLAIWRWPEATGKLALALLDGATAKAKARSKAGVAKADRRAERHRAQGAQHAATARAWAAAVPKMTATYAEEVREVSIRVRPALARAAEHRADRRRGSGFGSAIGGGLGAFARLIGIAAIIAVCVAAVVAAAEGVSQWHKALTQDHVATVIVCRSYLAGGWGDPKTGAIDTSAGTFMLDPIKVGNRAFTSTGATSLFQRGQLVRITWHGRSGSSSYVTAVTVLKPSGSSCSDT